VRLLVGCPQCLKEARIERDELTYVELRDDAYYDIECGQGHRGSVLFTVEKFAVLFESGAMALLDGYTREAVSSFAASLERFYEYWIRVALFGSGVTPESIESGWKLVARQSERQYGAFCVLYQREFGEVPVGLSTKRIEFRNDVIHKGYVPRRAEVEEYASDVLILLVQLWRELDEKIPTGISKVRGAELGKALSKVPDRTSMSTLAIETVFSHVAREKGQVTFDQALKELQRRREDIFRR
jgi:hypothetical protein